MLHSLALLLVAQVPPEPDRTARQVQITAVQETDGTHTLTHELVVDATNRDVWIAISTPEGWRTWAAPVARQIPTDGTVIETSYTPGATIGDPTTIRQSFLAKVPERLLVFRTTKAPEGFPHFGTFQRVVSIFELEQLGPRRTRVRLTSVAYANTDAGRQLLKFFREGNRLSLEQLRKRFADGPIDWSVQLDRRR